MNQSQSCESQFLAQSSNLVRSSGVTDIPGLPKLRELPSLGVAQVHVWLAPLSPGAPQKSAEQGTQDQAMGLSFVQNLPQWQVLNEDERAWAQAMGSDEVRLRYVMSRSTLRRLAGAYLDVSPCELRLGANRFGKPRIVSPGGVSSGEEVTEQVAEKVADGLSETVAQSVEGKRSPASLKFNISHSGDLLLVAFFWKYAVGVDIEKMRPIDTSKLSKKVFTPEEQLELESLNSDAAKLDYFFRIWVRKEALVKSHGTGIAFGALDETDVRADLVRGWTVKDLVVKQDYRAAWATEMPAEAVVYDLSQWEIASGVN